MTATLPAARGHRTTATALAARGDSHGAREVTVRLSRRPTAGDLFLGHMTDESVAEDADLETVVDLLDDEHVRSMLAETSAAPRSAAELAGTCDVSTTAIYRRADRLVDADLLRERTRPRSDGHHETVYVAALERFELSVREGDIEWTVDRRETDVADELTRLWGKF